MSVCPTLHARSQQLILGDFNGFSMGQILYTPPPGGTPFSGVMGNLGLPFLGFWISLFFPLQGIPCFGAFSPFSRDFRGSVEIENPCFFLMIFLALFPKQGRTRNGVFLTSKPSFPILGILAKRVPKKWFWRGPLRAGHGIPSSTEPHISDLILPALGALEA